MVYNLYIGWVCVTFSSSSFSSFKAALAWRNYIFSLSNSIYKFISNLLNTAYDVDLCQMASVLVLSFSSFIISILLKISALFKTFLWLMFSSPFFVCLVYSSSFDTIYFSLTIQSSVYYSGQFFLYEIPAKEQSDFQLYFRCIWFFFTWESFVLSSVLFL